MEYRNSPNTGSVRSETASVDALPEPAAPLPKINISENVTTDPLEPKTGMKHITQVAEPTSLISNSRGRKFYLPTQDSHTQNRICRIVREQLDLELYMKQKEINTIMERLRQSEALINVVESAIQMQHKVGLLNGATDDGYSSQIHKLAETTIYCDDTLQHNFQNTIEQTRSKLRPRRAAALVPKHTIDSSSGIIFARSIDGEVVRLECPDCGRDEFISMEEFLSHCRHQHMVEFASHDESIRICGVPYTPAEPDGELPRANTAIFQNSQAHKPVSESRLSTLTTRLSTEQRERINDAIDFINAPHESSSASSSPDSDNDNSSALLMKSSSGMVYAKAGARAGANSESGSTAQESRFHVIRRATLGNSSQYIDPEMRPIESKNSTHKWTLYLRSADKDYPVSDYIRKVRVFLHPSYRPDDIVDLRPPEFELTRWGWGEFPIRLQVFFCDKRNKPVDLIHLLKLDDTCSSKSIDCTPTPIDFEIDRRGLSKDADALALLTASPLDPPPLPPPPANPLLLKLFSVLCRLYPLVLDDALPQEETVPRSPEKILEMVPESITKRWTWGVALSAEIWRTKWPVGKRLAVETQRNRALIHLLGAAVDALSDGVCASMDADAYSTNMKERTKQALVSILKESGAQPCDIDSTRILVDNVDASCCVKCESVLKLWLNLDRSHACTSRIAESKRKLVPDPSRGAHQKSYAWSLKRWLRFHGFVPLPLFNLPSEAQYITYSQNAILKQSHTTNYGPSFFKDRESKLRADDKDTQRDYGVKFSINNKRARVDPPKVCYFCRICGVLESQYMHMPSNEKNTLEKSLVGESPPRPSYCSIHCEKTLHGNTSTVTPVNGILAKLPVGWDASEDEDDEDAMLMIDDDAAAYSSTATPAISHPSSPKGHSLLFQSALNNLASLLHSYHSRQQDKRSDANKYPDETATTVRDESSPHLEIKDNNGDPEMLGNQDNTDNSNSNDPDSEDPIDVSNDMGIDWVWSTIQPLELNCAPASRLSVTTLDNSTDNNLVQLPNSSNETFGEALDQRLVVGRLLLDVSKMFLRDMIHASDTVARQNCKSQLIDKEKYNQRSNSNNSNPPSQNDDVANRHKILMLTPSHIAAAIQRNPESFDICSNAFLADC